MTKIYLQMKKTLILLVSAGLLLAMPTIVSAQQKGCDPTTGKDPLGRDCGGAVQTAVPFMMINPDARSGAICWRG